MSTTTATATSTTTPGDLHAFELSASNPDYDATSTTDPSSVSTAEPPMMPSSGRHDQSSPLLHPAARHQDDWLVGEVKLRRRVLRKLDFILLPFLSVLFLMNSLDRSNIGNAETANFTGDTGLMPEDLNTAVAWFFAFFVALQPVGAAIGRKWGMAKYVPTVMLLWGFLTTAHIWVSARWQLITIRILIGILEAGFYPTTVSYLSLFYTRFEFAKRLGFFYGQSAVAGALGGCLSYIVFKNFPPDDHNVGKRPPLSVQGGKKFDGWKSWQILFLIEGSMTVLIAFAGFFWLPRGPGSAWFLESDERRCAESRIVGDRTALGLLATSDDEDIPVRFSCGHPELDEPLIPDQPAYSRNDEGEQTRYLLPRDVHDVHQRSSTRLKEGVNFASDQGLSRKDVVEAFTDWKVWYILVINIASSIPTMAFTVFLPLVVKGLGFDPTTANLLTVPPFLAGAVMLWIFTWWSDRRKERFIPVLWGLSTNLIGLTAVVMLPTTAYLLRYFSLCVLLAGSFIASPLTVAWLCGNMEEPGKRAIVLGINGWGTLAGIFSSLLFSPRYAPNYSLPFYVTFCCVLFAFFGYALFRWLLVRENARRRRILERWSPEEVESELMWGRGPSVHLRWTVLRVPWIGRLSGLWSSEDGHGDARRGDEKMTFCYGL